MAKILVRYRWRYFCPIRNKMQTTKAHFSEEQIKVEHPDSVPIDGTRIETVISDDIFENSTSAFLRNTPDVGNGIAYYQGNEKTPTKGGQ